MVISHKPYLGRTKSKSEEKNKKRVYLELKRV
jgi:hypothetical protein